MSWQSVQPFTVPSAFAGQDVVSGAEVLTISATIQCNCMCTLDLLQELQPWWMEEPTSPDDVLGHARIRRETATRIATGEHCQNAVMFKQLFQAGAIDVCQIDSCRVAGINENLAILLMAAKFGVPVCPHAGGVGLCEYVQHLSVFDYLARASRTRIRGALARAFSRSCAHSPGSLPTASATGVQRRNTSRVAGTVSISRRQRMEGAPE